MRKRLEYAIVALVFGLVVLGYSYAYQNLSALVERYQLEAEVNALRAATLQAAATQRPRGEDTETLDGANPVAWLDEPPEGYQGEWAAGGQGAEELDPGEWYFDTDAEILVYRVRHDPALCGGAPEGPPSVRFRVVADDGSDTGRGSDLRQVEPYGWGSEECNEAGRKP